MIEQLYYIQYKVYTGNCLIWWREGGHGYTNNLKEAWKVTIEQARQATLRPIDIIWPVEFADSFAVIHITQDAECSRKNLGRLLPSEVK
jgi:hypothetical protein